MTNYRTIVELSDGCHKILRLSYDQVAHVVTKVRQFRQSIFNDLVPITLNGVTLILNEILSWRFINEWTGEELLTI